MTIVRIISMCLLALVASSSHAVTIINKTKQTLEVILREGRKIAGGSYRNNYEPIQKVPLSEEVHPGVCVNIDIDSCEALYVDIPLKVREKGILFGSKMSSIVASTEFSRGFGMVSNDMVIHIIDHAAQLKRIEAKLREERQVNRSYFERKLTELKKASPDMVYPVLYDLQGREISL